MIAFLMTALFGSAAVSFVFWLAIGKLMEWI